MNPILFIAVSVAIAALIGGLTNYLAIRMLFHPRRPVRIAGYRLPFTPGLIPKRKDEIARSLGKVVADYLVTSEGISALLRREAFLQSAEEKLKAALRRLAEREETVEQFCLRFWSEEQWDAVKGTLARELGEVAERTVDWLWLEKGWAEKRIGELLPNRTEQAREALIERVVEIIVEAVQRELASQNGERLLRAMTGRILEQAGGFFGALAGMFMDGDKVAGKVREAIREALHAGPVRNALRQFIAGQLHHIEQLKLKEAIVWLAGEEGKEHPGSWLVSRLNPEAQLARILQMKWADVLGGRLPWIEERLPHWVRLAMKVVEQRVDRMVQALELPALVEAQVANFPVDRLERIILDISGREFRAITWLGALLGGMIGLVQALILQWVG